MLFWFRGLDNFMIFLTGCSGCGSTASSYVISCLKARLVSILCRFAWMLFLIINEVDFPDAVFELLCLQCFQVQFMSCFVSYVGVVAPVLPVQGTLQLVLPVVNAFLRFLHFLFGSKLLPKF